MLRLGNGFFAERLSDGAVRLRCEVRDGTGHVGAVAETEISADQWPNLVAGLSAGGKSAGNRRAAKALHEG